MRAFEPDFIYFASDAMRLALWGAAFLLLAGFAQLMERRRNRKAALNRVGWMPWTSVFMLSALLGGSLLAVALPVALAG